MSLRLRDQTRFQLRICTSSHSCFVSLLVVILFKMPSSFSTVIIALFSIFVLVTASPVPRALTGYAPVPATCPSTPLVRVANGISSAESSHISQRYTQASTALTAFLRSTNAIFSPSKLPVVALTTSGGGYRSLLTGTGVIQGFDSRDSQTGVPGFFQVLTYQTGLSGGS